MIDLAILEEKGCSAEAWKKILEGHTFSGMKDGKTKDDKITALRNRIRDRIDAGRNRNFETAKTYYALDVAWDTSLQQIPATLLRSLADSPPIPVNDFKNDPQGILNILKSWGIDGSKAFIVEDSLDPKVKGQVMRINGQELIKILVPLMKAYITIRWAKLTNDRRVEPFFQFDPAINTKKNRARCEALTSAVQVMARNYGYFNVMKQSVLRMLLYGICLVFPMEEWHTEEQLTRADDPDAEDPPKEPVGDEKPKKTEKKYKSKIVKEGLRYHHPHPSRMYWDQSHRVGTFNTDSGCTFGGHWRVMTFKEVRSNKGFFNTDKISYGTGSSWSGQNIAFFNTIYKCTLKFPPGTPVTTSSDNQRETKMADSFYTSSSDDDKSVVLVEHFEKLNPKDNGLGDYDHDIWCRFVIASDDTIVYAAPLPYCPVTYWGYDPDEYRDVNTSLGLEALPFQDHYSNVLSQIVLTTKQNLTNLVFIDEQAVAKPFLDQIRNLGERFWRVLNIIPFNRRKWEKAQIDPANAIISHKFPFQDVVGLMNCLRTILDTLERILVMSSQEVAQAASHEQTREEVRNISANTSTRLTFTAGGVDDALEAQKIQLYNALMAYAEDEFYAQIPSENGITQSVLDDLGFTYEGDEPNEIGKDKKIPVSLKKSAISLLSFASARDSADRMNNTEIAVAMMNTLSGWMKDPMVAQTIGADQWIDLANQTIRMAGFPRDFKLRNMAPGLSQQEQAAQAKQQMDMLIGEVMKHVQEGLMPTLEKVKENSDAISQMQAIMEQMQQRLLIASGAPAMGPPPGFIPQAPPPQMPPGPPMPPPVMPPGQMPMVAASPEVLAGGF